MDNQEIALNFVRLKTDDFLQGIEVEDGEIKAYYDGNGALLREPLKVKARYLAYRVEDFAADIEVSDQDVRAYYDVYRDRRFRRREGGEVQPDLRPGAGRRYDAGRQGGGAQATGRGSEAGP